MIIKIIIFPFLAKDQELGQQAQTWRSGLPPRLWQGDRRSRHLPGHHEFQLGSGHPEKSSRSHQQGEKGFLKGNLQWQRKLPAAETRLACATSGKTTQIVDPGIHYWRERISTVYLPALTSSDQLLFTQKVYFSSLQNNLLRRSAVFSLPFIKGLLVDHFYLCCIAQCNPGK